MRFLILAAASLALISAPTAWSADVSMVDFVPDMSHSRVFGPAAVHETAAAAAGTSAPTSSPSWTAGYGVSTLNVVTSANKLLPQLPYPPHTLQNFIPTVQPLPVGERFTFQQIFGRSAPFLASVPFSAGIKRREYSLKYNNTAFTSVSQFPKVGAGKLTSIDVFDDEFFGLMRLNGPNPTVIRKISTISPKFGELATLKQKYPKLNQLLKDGRIYELDYAKLRDVVARPLAAPNNTILAYPENGNPGNQQRYLAAPYVLLQHVEEGEGERQVSKIVPIAIQLGQSYVAGTTAVLYRKDYKDSKGAAIAGSKNQGDWNYAKTIVNAADATIHQLDAHLVKTHLVMENIIIATHAKLPENHVISRLIVGAGHSLKTLQINEDARNSLLPGIVDELFAGGYFGAAGLVKRLYDEYNWTADYIPTDLTTRGFERPCKSDGSDNYLYGQDALNTWKILYKYVNAVLKKSYPGKDRDVRADAALQAWAKFLSSPQRTFYPTNTTEAVPVPGFPTSFTTLDSLSDAVTAAVYKATVGHSVVNYPQPFYNAYIPIYPALALYRPILTASQLNTGLTTDAYIAAALGNANTQQMMTTTANGLGQPVAASGLPDDITLLEYATRAASGTPKDSDANRLLDDLKKLSESIQNRDKKYADDRKPHYQYGYFDPSRVANAIYA